MLLTLLPRLGRGLLIGACWAAVCVQAQAQAPAAAPPSVPPAAPRPVSTGAAVDTVPTVVISVTQVEQPAFDLPASVDVISGAQLRSGQRQVNLSETLSRVPGLQIQDRQNYAQDLQISSRGFGARSTFGIRGLRLYADGIPATQPDGQGQVSHFSLSSAARIEVLRGPFSALYGNSAGGVISIYTEDGAPGLAAGPSFSLGSFNTWRAGARLSAADEQKSFTGDWSQFATDGYRPHSAARRELENTKLKVRLDDATTLTWVVNNINMPSSQDPLGLSRAEYVVNPRQTTATAFSFDTRKSLKQLQTGLALEHAFTPADSVRVTGYLGERGITQFQAIPTNTQSAPASPGGVIDLARDYQGVDARYIHRGFLNDGAYTLTAGIATDNLNEARRGYNNFLVLGGPTGFQGALRRNENNRATTFDQYVQGEWQAFPGWRLSAGVRHSRVAISSHDHYFAAGNGDDSGAVVYSATTPAVGVVKSITSSLNAYVTAGRGFETPTLNELAYSPSGSGLNFVLKPAVSRQAEAGLKFNRGSLLVNAAVFAARTSNEIVVLSNTGGRAVYQNAGRTTRSGFELAATGNALGDVYLTLAYTYVNARYVDSYFTCLATPCAAGAAVLVPGQSRLPGVPQNSLYAEALWRPRPVAGAGPLAALEARMVGSVPVDDRNTDAASGYTVFNGRVGYEHREGNWTISEFARVDNLANHRYIGSVIVNESNGRYFEPSPGRTWTIGISAMHRFR